MLPLFVTNSSPDAREEISSLPGVYRFGIKSLLPFVQDLVIKGLRSVIIFGVDVHSPKDSRGSSAENTTGPCIEAIQLLKANLPQLLVAADVCLCPYSDTGHCGVFDKEGHMINQASIERLGDISVAYAKAGADIIAPSDMMDGRIGMIKAKLTEAGFGSRVSVLSYSAKFCSAYYGPFRDAAGSAPSFGDRRNYQLPPPSRSLGTDNLFNFFELFRRLAVKSYALYGS